ncbi:MAG: extracellular solute-binding protein [Deltaproteobacteria bacterium]|nr:extracellular solute-binding protein [Deltaproteobacteria bacterium]
MTHLLIALFLLGGPLASSPLAQTNPEIAAGAKKEGRVAYYTPLNLGAATLLIKSFEKEYPYVRVSLFRQGGEALRTRIFSEAQAGRHTFDVVSLNVLDVQLFKMKGLLTSYLSPQREGMPAGLKDKEGFWAASYIIEYVIGYNTHMVAREKTTRDWWDLLDPKWKDRRIGLDRDATVWYAAMLQYWGRERGLGFMKKLAGQKPHFERGNTLRTQMMAAGEFPLAVVHAHKVEEFKAKGAPIDWVTTADPIPAQGNVAAVSAHAPHPNAARLFLDYFLSKKGQMVMQEGGNIAARADIPPPTPSLDQSKLKVHYVDPGLAEHYNQYQKEYQQLFQ